MKSIQSLANRDKLQDAIDNIGIAFHAMEALLEISYIRAMSKSTQDIMIEMLDSDDEELTSDKEDKLTSNSGDESCNTCNSPL